MIRCLQKGGRRDAFCDLFPESTPNMPMGEGHDLGTLGGEKNAVWVGLNSLGGLGGHNASTRKANKENNW